MIGPVAALDRPLRFPHLETLPQAWTELVLHQDTVHPFGPPWATPHCPTCAGLFARWRELRDAELV